MASLENAQGQLVSLIQSLSNETTRQQFLSWIQSALLPEMMTNPDENHSVIADARVKLNQISGYLQTVVPVEAVLPSEQIHYPTQGLILKF